MMQSCGWGNDNSSSPQINQKTDLYQIFETDKYIFKVSSTLEKMYLYRYDSGTNEVTEKVVFRQVSSESVFKQFRDRHNKKIEGDSTIYNRIKYKVFVWSSEGAMKGYILSYKDAATKKTEYLYFVREN